MRVTGEREAELLVVRRRLLPDEDTTGCFQKCAMGIFIEALAIAAANAGRTLDVQRVDGDLSADLIPFARLRLAPGGERPFCGNDLILSRKTARLVPEARPVPAPVLQDLAATASAGGQRFGHTTDPALIRQILGQNIDAVFEDLNVKSYHDEIAGWYRYTERQAARTNDGLEARCMNIPAHEMWMSLAAPWLLRLPGTSSFMRAFYRWRLGGAPMIGWLAGEFFDGDSAPLAGRCLFRVWLRMAQHGVGLHPFGNLVTNAAAHQWLTRAISADKVWLVFRMGYTADPPRSRRLPVEEILC
jgi:hypothetical protein